MSSLQARRRGDDYEKNVEKHREQARKVSRDTWKIFFTYINCALDQAAKDVFMDTVYFLDFACEMSPEQQRLVLSDHGFTDQESDHFLSQLGYIYVRHVYPGDFDVNFRAFEAHFSPVLDVSGVVSRKDQRYHEKWRENVECGGSGWFEEEEEEEEEKEEKEKDDDNNDVISM
jgi:hypothetical protein